MKNRSERPYIGWPYRQEESGVVVKKCKVVRTRPVGKSSSGSLNKPWGW
jgi:hypothetical protein